MSGLRVTLTAIVLVLVCAIARAQGYALVVHEKPINVRHVKGKIVDSTGATIDYAQVELRDPNDHHLIASTFADAKGQFAFADRKRKTRVEILILRNGFEQEQYTVIVTRFGVNSLRLRMHVAT